MTEPGNQPDSHDQQLSRPQLIAVLVIGALLMIGFSFIVRPILHPPSTSPAPSEVSHSDSSTNAE